VSFSRKSLTAPFFKIMIFDIDTADVANAIGVRKIMEARGSMSDGSTKRRNRRRGCLSAGLSIAGDSESQNFSVADGFTQTG